jgi:hypothetical protein
MTQVYSIRFHFANCKLIRVSLLSYWVVDTHGVQGKTHLRIHHITASTNTTEYLFPRLATTELTSPHGFPLLG